ncbi:MAG: BglG family transcription antiterminator [Lachnospiraceae bacterium]|nr:BglG family transcription antiterminator [Lachnospiraceae bacterium]
MFLQREKKILAMLLKNRNGKSLTVAQIAAELQVSIRTVKADVRNINNELEKQSCCIKTKRGVGIWIDSDQKGEAYLKALLYEKQGVDIPAEIRKYYIASELLNYADYVPMEILANRFYVSKATVLNDLKKLEPFWRTNDIIFIKKVKYGVRTDGSEVKIRKVLFRLQKKIIEYSLGSTIDKLQILYNDVDLHKLEEIIRMSEKKFDFVFTDISFDELLIQIGIMVQRIKKGCRSAELPTPAKHDDARKEWQVSRYIQEKIAFEENCLLSETDMQELAGSLKGLRYQEALEAGKQREGLSIQSSEMFQYMMEVLGEADAKYLLSLSGDEEWVNLLFNHLEAMIHRIKGEMYLENPLMESVKNEMPYEYEIASYIVSKFSEKYGTEITDDEIGYVTFWVGAYLERLAQQQQRRYSVTIVCMTGMGTSQFISIKLKRLFPNIIVNQIISESMARNLEDKEQDFVITTVPLLLDNIDVVQVSVVLNDQDVKHIQKQIDRMDKTEQDQKEIYACLKEFLHEEISILQCDLKSREEAILLLGNRMIGEGYADAGYVESVLEREKISDTYMSGMIAIPHSFTGHVRKQGVGMLTLKNPVPWGEGQARIIFMLALDSKTDNEKFQKIFKAIYNLTRDMKDIDKFLKLKTFKDLKSVGGCRYEYRKYD